MFFHQSVEEYEKRLRTDLYDFMKIYAHKYQVQEASLAARQAHDADEER